MICTEYNNYIKTLLKNREMLWIVTLNNGDKVYSDYYNPTYSVTDAPWLRLKRYCKETGLFPCRVEVLMLGAPKVVMAEDLRGLDGLLIMRGSSKDFLMESGEGTSYKQLVVGVLDPVDDLIHVSKFCWPENEKEAGKESRLITPENSKLMFFKNGSKNEQRKSIQIALNGD